MFDVVEWDIDRLIPYARNPRKNDDAVPKLAGLIKEFGFKVPVVARSDGEVIDGHLRLKAAKYLGITKVPVVLTDEWSEAQVKAFRIAVNKAAEWADWDYDLLKLELEDLKNLDFDLDLIDFNIEDLPILDIKDNSESQKDKETSVLVESSTLDELAPSEEEKQHFLNKKILVEFSGGKDSSATALWAKYFFPENEIELMFCDMGADFTGMSFFLKDFAEKLGVPLKVIRSEKNIFDVFLDNGKLPHFRYPYCHEILHGALDDYVVKHKPEAVIIVRGGRLSEKMGNSAIKESRFLQIQRIKDYTYFQPFYFCKKNIGEELLRQNNLPIWEGYSYGLCRTACRICPGQKPSAYAAIRANFPEVWAELIELEHRIGTGYWNDPGTIKSSSIEELADRGQKKFEEGNFLTR